MDFVPCRPDPRAPDVVVPADGVHCDVDCPTPCALASLPKGVRAVIVRMACSRSEAHRLRVLGVFEGACVGIVDRGSGVLLDVYGSRLALGTSLAAAIMALPLR